MVAIQLDPYAYRLVNYLVGGFLIGLFVGAALMLAAIWINQKGSTGSYLALTNTRQCDAPTA
jgi:hypothetical protein